METITIPDQTSYLAGWFTVKQVSEMLMVSPSTIRAMIKKGRLRARNLSCGSHRALWRIHARWIRDYAESLPKKIQSELKDARM